MPGGPLGGRILRGMRWNLLGQAATVAVTLLVTPRLVAAWGEEGYGLYTMMWPLISYVTLLNVGVSAATQRFTAHVRDAASLSALLRRAAGFLVATTALGSLAVFLLRGWIVGGLLHVPGRWTADAAALVAWTAAAAVPHVMLVFGTNILYARQRFGAHALFLGMQTGGLGVLAAVLVAAGKGLPEIGASFLALETALAAAALWLAREPLRARPRLDREDLEDFIRFSGRSAAAQGIWVFTFNGDRLFIGRMLSVAQLGFYGAAAAIAQKLGMFTHLTSNIAYPLFTELQSAGEHQRLRRFYLKATQLSLYLGLPATVLVVVLAPQFLTLWLGEPFSRSAAWPLRLLALANLAYSAHMMPEKIASSRGAPHWAGFLQSAKCALLVALWLALIPAWGILGAAAGLLAAEASASVVFLAYVHRRMLDLGTAEFLAACARPAAAAAVLAACVAAVRPSIGSWPALLGTGALGLGAYLAAGWLVLDPESREMLGAWARRVPPAR